MECSVLEKPCRVTGRVLFVLCQCRDGTGLSLCMHVMCVHVCARMSVHVGAGQGRTQEWALLSKLSGQGRYSKLLSQGPSHMQVSPEDLTGKPPGPSPLIRKREHEGQTWHVQRAPHWVKTVRLCSQEELLPVTLSHQAEKRGEKWPEQRPLRL